MHQERDQPSGPLGERTRGQRLVTYAAITVGCAIASIAVIGGFLDIDQSGLYKPFAYIMPPLTTIYFAYRFVKQVFDRDD